MAQGKAIEDTLASLYLLPYGLLRGVNDGDDAGDDADDAGDDGDDADRGFR